MSEATDRWVGWPDEVAEPVLAELVEVAVMLDKKGSGGGAAMCRSLIEEIEAARAERAKFLAIVNNYQLHDHVIVASSNKMYGGRSGSVLERQEDSGGILYLVRWDDNQTTSWVAADRLHAWAQRLVADSNDKYAQVTQRDPLPSPDWSGRGA